MNNQNNEVGAMHETNVKAEESRPISTSNDNELNDMFLNMKIAESELNYINQRINSEVCFNTIISLLDTNLISEYKKAKSVKSKVAGLLEILTKNNVDNECAGKIIDEYIMELVPPGTKGAIKGYKFNKIVENTISSISLDATKFEVGFEKQCPLKQTAEIPDWYIIEKQSGKLLVGMNQLDLWGGGHQINRGSKYLTNNEFNTDTTKMICVVCNHIQFKTDKNKAYSLFRSGYETNTLCYINNVAKIINEFFGL